jgi:hypothetical protein
MSTESTTTQRPRLTAAIRLVLTRYYAQARRMPLMTLGCIVLPAAADILNYYAPPLVIARLLGRFARNESMTAPDLLPYVLTFAGLWIAGQVCWRIAVILITRVEIYGSRRCTSRRWTNCSPRTSRSSRTTTPVAHEAGARVRAPVRGRVRCARLPDRTQRHPARLCGRRPVVILAWLIVVLLAMLGATLAAVFH